jgi:hypothetical protein
VEISVWPRDLADPTERLRRQQFLGLDTLRSLRVQACVVSVEAESQPMAIVLPPQAGC